MAKVAKNVIELTKLIRAQELTKLIRAQLAEPKLLVAVYPKPGDWYARVYAEQNSGLRLQKRVDEAVRMLAAIYDLEN